jgi:hypothetical protein
VIEANDPRLKTAEGWDELGAPFDATHWVGPALQPWEKLEGGDRFIWHDSEWYESYVGRITDRFESILRPVDETNSVSLSYEPDSVEAENKWHDRSDFPPAGTECEMYVVTDWHLARIIGMDEEGLCVASVLFDDHRGYRSSAQIADFRPLKTDADRDAAIEEMLTFSPYPSSRIIREAYEALYDAGYRKPVNVTTTGLCPVPGLHDDDDDHASVKGTQ